MTKRIYPANSPEIKEGIKILWESGRYDGPLSGVLEYNGDKCYFDIKREYYSKEYGYNPGRTYWIYKLTEEQWKEISYWHEEFRLHVGTHCDYGWSEKYQEYERNEGNLIEITDIADHEYSKEMYYARVKIHNEKNGDIIDSINKKTQTIGWCSWRVLVGKPWKEWRKTRRVNV
jgi:hypothetical protein